MTRDEAFRLLAERLKNKNLFKHCLAVEACLKTLARKLGENEHIWGLAGLLHDIDYEETGADPTRHGLVGAELLERLGLDDQLVRAVKAHSGHLPPSSNLDWALFACDPLTGLIVASALMHPDKKLRALDVDFLRRRFKEKRFAAGANREQIGACKNLGMELDDFMQVCLEGMQGVSEDLGL
ncbi:phosphohydrolase [candidate division WOR_3 bacterium SM23_42]|uniref:Phosphohydrolase n=1 Tax=candidate division WOR_3 bacterium SM23_42 TaxID=1703779 RepID=A0A0S8FS28_UNCW3|nr:MAG: phosphohydrolase [candidate division WOR_3 bacterium SM23_42]